MEEAAPDWNPISSHMPPEMMDCLADSVTAFLGFHILHTGVDVSQHQTIDARYATLWALTFLNCPEINVTSRGGNYGIDLCAGTGFGRAFFGYGVVSSIFNLKEERIKVQLVRNRVVASGVAA